MFTEDEAKTKICPKMQYCANAQGVIQDRDQPFYEQSTCQASACMAWRWGDGYYETVSMDNRCVDEAMSKAKGIRWLTHTDGPPPPPAGKGWEPMGEPRQADGFVEGVLTQKWRRPHGFRQGYCGAFGRPS